MNLTKDQIANKIETLDLEYTGNTRELFDEILNNTLKKFDPENELYIRDTVQLMPLFIAKNLLERLETL